jgi:hypothetical protein
MKYSSIFGYIGAIIGILLGLYYILIVAMFINPWDSLAFLGSIIFSISGLFAIKLSSKDTEMAAFLFLVSGLGIFITMVGSVKIISFILFAIAAALEFRNKNKIKINDINQRRKLIIFQFIIVLLIPLLYFIQSFYIINP